MTAAEVLARVRAALPEGWGADIVQRERGRLWISVYCGPVNVGAMDVVARRVGARERVDGGRWFRWCPRPPKGRGWVERAVAWIVEQEEVSGG